MDTVADAKDACLNPDGQHQIRQKSINPLQVVCNQESPCNMQSGMLAYTHCSGNCRRPQFVLCHLVCLSVQ